MPVYSSRQLPYHHHISLSHTYLNFIRSCVNTDKLKKDLLGLILLEGPLEHLHKGLLSAVQVF